MKAAIPLILIGIAVGLIVTGTAVYIINPTISEIKVGNETIKIGVRDVVKTFIEQTGPLPSYKHIYNDSEIINLVKDYEGFQVKGIPKEIFEIFGNTIEFCFTKDSIASCLNVTVENDRLYFNKYPANKTIYIDYALKDKIIEALKNQDRNALIKIFVVGIKEGKIKGLKIEDLKLLASLL